jgi:hypothetical protein
MALSIDTVKRLFEAVTSQTQAGPEVVDAINAGASLAAQSGASIAAAIKAAHVSTTTDFAALAVGDLLVHIPATAGNASFETVATAGTKPSAAVVGDLYIAIRANAAPASVKGVIKL